MWCKEGNQGNACLDSSFVWDIVCEGIYINFLLLFLFFTKLMHSRSFVCLVRLRSIDCVNGVVFFNNFSVLFLPREVRENTLNNVSLRKNTNNNVTQKLKCFSTIFSSCLRHKINDPILLIA